MVQCPVGNRCQKCSKGKESHLIKMTPWLIMQVCTLSLIASQLLILIAYAFRWACPYFMVDLIVTCIAGFYMGKLIHRVSDYKLPEALTPYVMTPLIIGFILNPFGSPLAYFAITVMNGDAVNYEMFFQLLYAPILGTGAVVLAFNRR